MVQSGSHYKEQGGWNNVAENKDLWSGGGADNGGYDKVRYLEETCIIKMFGKANVHTQICIQQIAEYAQNGADCLELLFCINVTETKR
jgi:hypothetical protein